MQVHMVFEIMLFLVTLHCLTTLLQVHGAPPSSGGPETVQLSASQGSAMQDPLEHSNNLIGKNKLANLSPTTSALEVVNSNRHNIDASSILLGLLSKLVQTFLQKEDQLGIMHSKLQSIDPVLPDLDTEVIISLGESCYVRVIQKLGKIKSNLNLKSNIYNVAIPSTKPLDVSHNSDYLPDEFNRINYEGLQSDDLHNIMQYDGTVSVHLNPTILTRKMTKLDKNNLSFLQPSQMSSNIPMIKRSVASTKQLVGPSVTGTLGASNPQSIAGSSLYGSYAYAHVSPFGQIYPYGGGIGSVPYPVAPGQEKK